MPERDAKNAGASSSAEPGRGGAAQPASGFLPSRPARPTAESVLVRLIATAGVVGIGTAVGTILGANDVTNWIMALVVSLVSVILAAVLWRSSRL